MRCEQSALTAGDRRVWCLPKIPTVVVCGVGLQTDELRFTKSAQTIPSLKSRKSRTLNREIVKSLLFTRTELRCSQRPATNNGITHFRSFPWATRAPLNFGMAGSSVTVSTLLYDLKKAHLVPPKKFRSMFAAGTSAPGNRRMRLFRPVRESGICLVGDGLFWMVVLMSGEMGRTWLCLGCRRLLILTSGCFEGQVLLQSLGLNPVRNTHRMPQQAKSFIKGTQRSLQQSGQGAEASRYTVWQDSLARLVRESFPASYDLVDTTGLVGLLLCTFVKGRDGRRFRLGGLSVESVKTGVGGLHGNKGAIMLRMQADDTSVAFVNCHLAAHQEKVVERNFDCASIANGAKFETLDPWTTARGAWDFAAASSGLTVGGGDGSMLMDHETIFWFGDLNYRIDLSRKEVMDAIARRDWGRLLERDQLAQQRPSSGAPPAPGPPSLLRNFDEAPIDFAPTFKFDAGSDNYDSSEKMRIPAYCDRVLHRGKQVRQRKYSSHVVRTSDHRPVSAAYEVGIRSVNAASREKEAGKLVQELWERWIPLGRKAAIDALREEARMCSRRN